MRRLILGVLFLAVPITAAGGEANVLDVEVTAGAEGTWRFDVTV